MNLQKEVEDAVMSKISNREAFTAVDISHPIIKNDQSVRHRQVREVINAMINNGVFDQQIYTSSAITVYPQPNKPVTARLFHPDDPSFDINSYTATNQELDRGTSGDQQGTKTRGFDMTDSDGDDGTGSDGNSIQMISTTSAGVPVRNQCFVQAMHDTINIPRVVVKAAGFASGDGIKISNSGGNVTVERDASGKQQVDKEGRIRLHGSSISGFVSNKPYTAVVVEPSQGNKYIQIQ